MSLLRALRTALGHDDVCAYHLHGQGDDFLNRGVVSLAPSEWSHPLELRVEALDEAVGASVGP